ncbi:hypothetical protein R50073_02920 [Maricurvus nonylphenolicus]|uniref:sterol desaturase family protein n=1 Tax=Maricurvus nonylphenolicus TaxID=1008307 RepID=UPI0036F4389F
MDISLLFNEAVDSTSERMGLIAGVVLISLIGYEWLMGRYRDGRKTREDWAMGFISIGMLAVVQRPLLMVIIFLGLSALFPAGAESLRWLELEYFWPTIIGYCLIDEYLHGRAHLFAHVAPVETPWLRKIQNFYKRAHRPHHQIGGNDGRGELSVTHTYVEHWGWWLILPNYWFGIICLYFGLYEIFFWGTLVKTLWGMHVHTNWGHSYDLYLLNHSNAWVRKLTYAVCHVFTLPNMHHQHHSRSQNSAKNMTNFISVFDWLLWDTLVIEQQRPETYGWRQTPREEHSALYRYFHTNFKNL